jgi:Ca2+-transporting ATPase
MTARSIYTLAYPSVSFGLTGVGYDPRNGALVRSNRNGDAFISSNGSYPKKQTISDSDEEFGAIQALFQVACLCNNASISQSESMGANSNCSGQPTELALLVGALKSKIPDPRPQYHRIQEIPFTSDRKRMEVRARPSNGKHSCAAFTFASENFLRDGCKNTDASMYFVKGMPEAVLCECVTHITSDGRATLLTDQGKKWVLSHSRKMASSGLRVLAMAYGPSLDDLTFAGLIGMEDPPREGVAEAVHQLHQSGVSVLMVTGDSKETALAIGKKCGIIGSRQCAVEMQHDSDVIDMIHNSHTEFEDFEFGAGLGESSYYFFCLATEIYRFVRHSWHTCFFDSFEW